MTLSQIQSNILKALAAGRNPDSYMAGGSVLNSSGHRYTKDLDIFHDRDDAVSACAIRDGQLLESLGYSVRWTRRLPTLFTAIVTKSGDETHLDWARDSDFRFFPIVHDESFGYRLHLFDIATNKALAAASRREPRDIADLVYIEKNYIDLGSVIFAAVSKDPGFSPESLIGEIRRNARYVDIDLADIQAERPITAADLSRSLKAALSRAEQFCAEMPASMAGCAFVDQSGRVVHPNPDTVRKDGQTDFIRHSPCRGGHWPSLSSIGSAMIDVAIHDAKSGADENLDLK